MQGNKTGLKPTNYFEGGESVIGCDEKSYLRRVTNENRSIYGPGRSETKYMVG